MVGKEAEMMRRRRWCVFVILLFGGLALAAGCARFPGEVDFSAEPTTGKAPLAVRFTAAVCGALNGFVWSFGDGTTSTERNPEHTYSETGSYTVTLLVIPRSGDPIATTKPDYIHATSGGLGAGRLTPIYWTEAGKPYVQRCLRTGTSVEGLDMWIDGPADVAVTGGAVYWTDTDRGQVVKHDLLTAQNTVLQTGRDLPYGIAVNGQIVRVYWTERYDIGLGADGMVMQAFMDGTGASSVRQTMGPAYDITVDPIHNTLYWTQHFSVLPRDFGSGSYGIRSRNLTTSAEQQVVKGLTYIPYGIAVDSVSGKIYWTGNGAIHRCSTDGTSVQTLVSGADSPRGIAVDPAEGKIYWGENGRIRRANLDGSSAETILTGLGQVIGLTLAD
jgi:PKD repeat protein